MLNRFNYSYNNEESIIHRLNPVVKIFGLFIYSIICLLKFHNLLFIVNLSFVFLFILLSNVRITKYFRVVWKLKYILIIMYAYMYHKQMVFVDMNIIIFKFVFFVLYVIMIVYTTTKEDLGKGGSKVLNIFNLVGISLRKISSFLTNIFTYFLIWIDTYNEVFTCLEIKGNNYTYSSLIKKLKMFFSNFKLVIKKCNSKMSLRKKDKKYKLYNGNVKSQYKYRRKLYIFDYLFIILNIGMIIFYILKVR